MEKKILDYLGCRMQFEATFDGLGMKHENNKTFVRGLCLKNLYLLNDERVTLYAWVPLLGYSRELMTIPIGSTIQFSAYITNSDKERNGRKYNYPLLKNPLNIKIIN